MRDFCSESSLSVITFSSYSCCKSVDLPGEIPMDETYLAEESETGVGGGGEKALATASAAPVMASVQESFFDCFELGGIPVITGTLGGSS